MSSEYPSDWDSRRNDVYERDGYQCQNCGSKGGPRGQTELHAHHIVPKSKGGTHQRSNLITVCKDCHNAIHGNSVAPTKSSTYSSISSERELIASVANILEQISESENKSNDAMDRLINLIESTGGDGGFTVDEYSAIRYEVIKQAFNVKEQIETYQSTTREHLNQDARIDIDNYTDAAWDSIQSKIVIIGRADDLLMEFADRDIECSNCGEIVDKDSKFCKNCGKEIQIIPRCNSCGNEIEKDSNFCSQCGEEINEEINDDSQVAVDQKAVEGHVDELRRGIENAIEKATFTRLLEQRFRAVWVEDLEVVWDYCPNCGLERGVVQNYNEATCVLCDAEWKRKGILNRHWEATIAPNIEQTTTDSEHEWESLGRKKNEKEIYKQKFTKLREQNMEPQP